MQAWRYLGIPYEVYETLPGTKYWTEEGQLTRSRVIAMYRTLTRIEMVQQDIQWND